MTTLEYLEKVVLKTLWNHKYSWIFQQPTDETNFLSNNTNVIKNPPDLMTIRKKFDTKSYTTAVECLQDFHSIFRNCYLHNMPSSDIVSMARELEAIFVRKIADMLPEDTDMSDTSGSKSRKRRLSSGDEHLPERRPAKQRKDMAPKSMTAWATSCSANPITPVPLNSSKSLFQEYRKRAIAQKRQAAKCQELQHLQRDSLRSAPTNSTQDMIQRRVAKLKEQQRRYREAKSHAVDLLAQHNTMAGFEAYVGLHYP